MVDSAMATENTTAASAVATEHTNTNTNGHAFPSQDEAGATVAAIAQAETISADEIALYDRQIRLWGVQAQEKIRSANILLISIRALANEVAKNLVLAGIASITLADHEVVTEDDLGAQFLITEADIGKNRAEAAAPQLRKLNPRVKVNVITRDVRGEKAEAFFTTYDVMIATDLDFEATRDLDSGASLANTPFYAGASHGFYGYIFADLGRKGHEFVVEREKSNRPTVIGAETATRSIISTSTKKENGKAIELVTKQERYTPLTLVNSCPLPLDMQNNIRKLRKVHPLLTCIRTLWEFQHLELGVFPSHSHEHLQRFTQLATQKHAELGLPAETLKADLLRSFLQNLGSELAPVTAFLGGQLAQDVINVLGKREQPIQNLMLFDGEESVAPIYTLHADQFSDAVKAAVPVIPAGADVVVL